MNNQAQTFAALVDYQVNAKRLPFHFSSAYQMRNPDILPGHISLYAMNNGEKIGCLRINFYVNTLYINYIGTENLPGRKGHKEPGVARELVRRCVVFAYENGIPTVTTSRFSEKGSAFWMGLGFRSQDTVILDWMRAPSVPKPTIDVWNKKIEQTPDILWKLARTKIGRKTLYGRGGPGILDFSDARQRKEVFQQLRLPQNMPG